MKTCVLLLPLLVMVSYAAVGIERPRPLLPIPVRPDELIPVSSCTPTQAEKRNCTCEFGSQLYRKDGQNCVFDKCARGDTISPCNPPLPVRFDQLFPKSTCTPTEEERATCKCQFGIHLYKQMEDKCVFDMCALGDQISLCEEIPTNIPIPEGAKSYEIVPATTCIPNDENKARCQCTFGTHVYSIVNGECIFVTCADAGVATHCMYSTYPPERLNPDELIPRSSCTPTKEEKAICNCEFGIHLYKKEGDKCVFDKCALADTIASCRVGTPRTPVTDRPYVLPEKSTCTPTEEEKSICKCQFGEQIYKNDDGGNCVFENCGENGVISPCV